MMATAQLKIDTDIVRIVTSLVLGGAALGFSLSFGLGTRDVAGQQGVPRAIPATHVIMQSEGHDPIVANATLLDHIVKQ
jgi:hypothetical protein